MKEYYIQWWTYVKDNYDSEDEIFLAYSEEEALSKAMKKYPRGKQFEVLNI